MKKIALIVLLLGSITLNLFSAECVSSDTTFRFNDKMIYLKDSVDQVHVRVFQKKGDLPDEYKNIYEGIYTDGKSYEKFSVSESWGLHIPFISTIREKKIKRRFEMQPHWAGVGLGYACFTDGTHYNDIDGIPLNLMRSYEFNYNIFEHITPIFFHLVGLTTGLGFSWEHYYLDHSTYLRENTDGVVRLMDGSGRDYRYSKLNNWYLTAPLLLELQLFKSTRMHPYVACGVVGGLRLATRFKTKYEDMYGWHKSKERGMNVLPLTYSYLFQAGCGNVSVYGKYSPVGLFEAGKGPEVQHASAGFMIDF
jgi:hypothetical protein